MNTTLSFAGRATGWLSNLLGAALPVDVAPEKRIIDLSPTNFERFSIRFSDAQGRDQFEVVRLIAAEIARLEITHSFLGTLTVRDGRTRWRVEPAIDRPRISGWVQADTASDREQIVAAIHDFLTEEVGLSLS
ncbi:hypothetical protein [Sphingomonas immobilis]|uniref:Uncharacterized protein n=1 Tax=Sphingomonas immobilis TaxID=3063997 RepID=A0ABT9A363_9SPHN|nr:hypothetical protein [Sphingomonas sp. CA1-15]MDO7844286.1 hypothetical protein [Sphingomonas sp. CA1-15]